MTLHVVVAVMRCAANGRSKGQAGAIGLDNAWRAIDATAVEGCIECIQVHIAIHLNAAPNCIEVVRSDRHERIVAVDQKIAGKALKAVKLQ